jgi:N-glycosylase/DNA lyase
MQLSLFSDNGGKNFGPVIKEIASLRSSSVKEMIDSKMREFELVGLSGPDRIFSELCFCFMTANFSAAGGIKIQNEIGDGFINLAQGDLAEKLAQLGHRFPNARAKYVIDSRAKKDELIKMLKEIDDDLVLREWIVKNIKGVGMKEASHFLRNIGYKNLAIIDFHIIDLLVKHNLIEMPKSKSLTPKKYLEVEDVLREISKKTGLHLGELDLYLWYLETGKILK